ncbi:transmembrane protein 131 homolog isoform X2 [Drosophila eugracilis]|uniref:transmembrane protein 131 homolog isoform X2 n=1 Tax=Drosophila eugracilis TaxID=29029 RepID=UPI0007E743EC|nr:transmembrane protein 131 homolog isoform X2 [Drosophila eugracilis]
MPTQTQLGPLQRLFAEPFLLILIFLLTLGASGEKVLQEGFLGLQEPPVQDLGELLRDLRLVPSRLDFGTWSVGQARSQTVTLFNQHANRTLQLNAVAGPSPAFYSSFLGTREVPPQGNTTFSVVFLPRQLGAIAADLLIHTSFGQAELAVQGEGSECPYRLKPLVGIKAPMNATLTPEIHMYNPHERPLQILEIYSSGGEFQLELPTGGSEGPQNLWEIPPHTLKPVIRISFHGRTAGNHSAYIRIKIAEQEMDLGLENVLVIPVEFEILPRHFPYARNPLADFGRVATSNVPDALQFKLDVRNDDSRLLFGTYLRPIPGLSFDANNTSIVLDPRMLEGSEIINDLLVIKSNQSSSSPETDESFTVLVRAEIFHGGLIFDGNVTKFVTTSPEGGEGAPLEMKRSLVVRNNFAMPLLLFNVSLTEPVDESILEVTLLGDTRIQLQPGESVELLHLNLLNDQVPFNSFLKIETNVTVFKLPLVSCSGRLHVSTQPFVLNFRQEPLEEKSNNLELDLGTVPFAEMSRDGFVILRNDNPVPVKITNWFFKHPKTVYSQSTFLGCRATGSRDLVNVDNETKGWHLCTELRAGEIAVFKVAIQTYEADATSGTLKVWTPHEVIRVRVKFEASVGHLEIEQEQLNFKNCFPGKMCTAVLSIRSSFTHPVHVKGISFALSVGLRFKDFNAKGTTIAPQTLTKVGRIYFEPAAVCRNQCYIKESTDNLAIFPNVPGGGDGNGGVINNNLLYDGVELRQRTELFRQLRRQLSSMSLTLHSGELPPLELDFSITIEWPKLVQFQPIPPTPAIEVGQVQRQWITLTNPSQNPLLIDYFLSDPAFARRTQLSLPHEVIDVSSTSCYLTDKEVFSLPDAGDPILLPGGASLNIPITFSAQLPEKYCTLLHVRSNLTLYEAVWLQARAVQSQFRFGNRRPGSASPLLFEMATDQFLGCKSGNGAVVATRSFTARNSGVIPMRIEGFLIGSLPCEDFGFKVMDCEGFDLGENETKKVEIAFSADFTSSRVKRSLTLLTNLTYDISYLLLAQMPAESVELCASLLVRPAWESSLKNAALLVLMVSFGLVLVAAVFDAKAIMAQQSAYDAARNKGPLQPTFNLRNIVKLQAEETAAKAEAMQQQQKARNGQLKELRKRSVVNSTTKSKSKSSWSPWSMDMNALTAAPLPEAKPVKKPSTPSPQAVSSVQVRPQKKAKPTVVPLGLPKPKPESGTPIVEQLEKPSAKSSPPQQENISPKPNKTPEARVLKEQNGSVKKIGKTPGRERERERRKDQKMTNGSGTGVGYKKPERKQRQKLNFGLTTNSASPPASPDALKSISTWETSSGVSFRDMVTSPFALQATQFAPSDHGFGWSHGSTSSDLGPIGDSRKNSTPPTLPSPWKPLSATDSSSLFANRMTPVDVNYEHRERDENQWEQRSDLVLQQQIVLQQSQQLEIQPRQQEKLSYMGAMDPSNWSTNWSPLGYSSWPDTTSSMGVIRPPPGLEQNARQTHNNLAQVSASAGAASGIGPAVPGESLPTQYDPFTSPSSIWSDTWRQSSQRNNHNHMN